MQEFGESDASVKDASTNMEELHVPPVIDTMQEFGESHASVKDVSTNMELHVPPVIDLNDENALELIGTACKSWGIFQVVNHNIRKSVIDEMEAAGKRLFALPMEQKLKAERSLEVAGGYGAPVISLSHNEFARPEGFTVIGSPLEHARRLWPIDSQTFCDVTEEYDKEMNTLAVSLLWLMLGSVGITKDDVEWGGPNGDFDGGYSLLQLNSYQPCADPDQASGLVAHTDSSFLTIMHQSTSTFQVHHEGFGWVTIPPLQGALVVIIGDLLHVLSNGLFSSAFHRALANRTQYRITICYFYGPHLSVKVSPLPKLVDHSEPPLYRPITWSEYREIKYKYFHKALENIRVCTKVDECDECFDADDHPHSLHVDDESTINM